MPERRASAAPTDRAVPAARDLADPPPVAAAGRGASGLRRAILVHLRQNGPSSPDQLAASLQASRSGILQQLRALEAAKLVGHDTERHGVGRPRHVYDVTADAQNLFPANYDALATGLLDAIDEVGGEALVDQVFASRRRQLAERVRRQLGERLGAAASLAERVGALAVIQDEQGYLSEAQLLPDGTVRLLEHNCAILHVAGRAPAACSAELDLFREVLGADVVRETHIASGDRCCSYRITAGGPPGRPS